MSIKDYPTEQLLSELAARVRTDNPLYDPQELRDMLINSESECSELRAQVERKETRIQVLEVANDSLTQYSSNLTTERDKLRQALIEICNIVGGATDGVSTEFLMQVPKEVLAVKAERDALKARIEEMDAHGDRDMLLAQWNKAAAERDKFRGAYEVERDRANDLVNDRDMAETALAAVTSERDSNKELYDAWYRNHLRKLEAVKAERDALQARIDAGVRVWGKDLGNGEWCWSYTEYHTIDTHTAILIDPRPIDHIADANKMVDDDRKNDTDRRFGFARGSCWRINQTDDTRGKYRTAVPNTRRRKPGTKADRKPSWTRADGSTTPRTGERRVEGSWEYCSCHQLLEPSCHKNMDYCWRPTSGDGVFAQDNRRDPSGANDRRKGKA